MTLTALFSITLLCILQRVTAYAPIRVKGPVAAAWYAGWHATGAHEFPLSAISWDKYNTLIYSFAITTPSVDSISLDGSDPPLLPDFVSQAHQHGVAAHIAIGGWGGSRWFSSSLATPENRTAFVKTVTDFATKYQLDGIDFDWEYPNKQGIGCNTISADDTQNFLSFLQALRKDPVGATLTLSAATAITPFLDASGNPSQDVSGFAKVLDYISIMNYDVWGSWSSAVGPNAPLNDTCAPPADRVGSAVSAVKAWTAAKMPVNQIVLGVPSYGHSFTVQPSNAFVSGSETELVAYPMFDASKQPPGDAWDNTGGNNACGVYQGPGGTFNLWGLIDGGFLTPKGDPAQDIYYRYDSCSQTPYVYNKTSQVMVSFDNAKSFAAKGSYIKEAGLKGFAMWQAGGDYKDTLLQSIRHPRSGGGLIALLPLYSHCCLSFVEYPVVLMSEIDEVQLAPTDDQSSTETAGWPWPHFPRTDDPSVGIDQQTYDNLVRYTKYASGAYQLLCPRPMGNILVLQFHDIITSTKGFIARDDKREEFVVAFRGSSNVSSILVDITVILVPLHGPGLPSSDLSTVAASAEPRVHAGFLLAYNSVAQTILDALESQLRAYPSYTIIVCGHSLGGSIASIASVAFSHTFTEQHVTLYTFGQPRVGDHLFAELVERTIGTDHTYRCVHLVDGVPTMIPTLLGYRHFGTEYWQFAELGAPKNVKRLEGGEDPNGSASVPCTGINPAHWVYFGQREFFWRIINNITWDGIHRAQDKLTMTLNL